MDINSCPDPELRSEWEKYGAAAFSLVILEELKKQQEQTSKEFSDDIKLMRELWLEKLGRAELE